MKILFRQFFKNKLFAFINVIGLSVGMAVFLTIAFFIKGEYSYDQFHENVDRIAKMGMTGRIEQPLVFGPIGEQLAGAFDEVEKSTRYMVNPKVLIEAGERRFYQEGIASADPDFLDIFTFSKADYTLVNPLREPNSFVITQSLKEKCFGQENAIGESIKISGETYLITEVIPDVPSNSTLKFSGLRSFKPDELMWFMPTEGYFLLNEHTAKAGFADKLESMDLDRFGIPKPRSGSYKVVMSAFSEVHLLESSATSKASIYYVRIFMAIGIVVLLIACVNYINMAVAKSYGRSKEAGIRKVLGAGKSHLISRFLQETLLFSLISGIISIALVERLSIYFRSLTQLDLLPNDSWPFVLITLVVVITLIGLISGLYPALKLSRISMIKGGKSFQDQKKGTRRRNLLLGFQFAVSLSLILVTLAVAYQLTYLRTSDLGFDKNAKLIIRGKEGISEKSIALKAELLKVAGVESVSYAKWVPGSYSLTMLQGKNIEAYAGDPDEQLRLYHSLSDVNLKEALSLNMVEGNWFGEASSVSAKEVIINETTRALIDKENVLGAQIVYNQDTLKVIGVVANLKTESFRSAVEPAIFMADAGMSLSATDYAVVSLSDGNLEKQMTDIEAAWSELIPEFPLDYSFLEDKMAERHQKETELNQVFVGFSIVSVILCLLGLLGLSSYMQETRQKEFSIHKVLGAKISRLIGMVIYDYLKVILISLTIAVPVAYYASQAWLQSFVYRFEFNLLGFSWPLLVIIGLCLGASLIYILKLARVNPAETLRSE
ncbi:MAG: FtsX-like permease family protein [Roseivirga sp.]|nr:FtsX-like permease family protein [Roseivirga sp.]